MLCVGPTPLRTATSSILTHDDDDDDADDDVADGDVDSDDDDENTAFFENMIQILTWTQLR